MPGLPYLQPDRSERVDGVQDVRSMDFRSGLSASTNPFNLGRQRNGPADGRGRLDFSTDRLGRGIFIPNWISCGYHFARRAGRYRGNVWPGPGVRLRGSCNRNPRSEAPFSRSGKTPRKKISTKALDKFSAPQVFCPSSKITAHLAPQVFWKVGGGLSQNHRGG